MRQTLYFLLLACFQFTRAHSQDFWQPLGGPDGINIRYLYYDGQGYCYALDYQHRFFRSSDQGRHWTSLTPPVTGQLLPLANFSCGFDGRLFCLSTTGDLLTSADHGENWTLMNTSFDGVERATSLPGGVILASNNNGLFRSFDAVSWQQIIDLGDEALKEIYDIGWLPNGLAVVAINDFQNQQKDQFLTSSTNGFVWDTLPGMTYIKETAPAGAGKLVFKHADLGLFLSAAGALEPIAIPHPFPIGEQYSFLCLPTGRLFISNGYQTLFSDNFGQQWQLYSGELWGLLHSTPLPGQVLIKRRSSFQGAFRSVDLGHKWSFSGYGPDHAWAYDWTFNGADTVSCFTSAGLWRSSDGLSNWDIVPMDSCVGNFDSLATYNLTRPPDGGLLMLRPGRLLRSDDHGETFTDITPDANLGVFTRVSVQPGTGFYYLVCTDKLLRSVDKGATWNILYEQSGFLPQKVWFHPSGTLYAYKSDQSLIRSTDQGASWQPAGLNVTVTASNPLLIDQNGRIIVAGFKKIWVSDDDGQQWTARNAPFDIQSVAADQEGNLMISCLTDNRLFISKNDGVLWQKLPDVPGLTASDGIISLAVSPAGLLYVSTDQHGQFRSINTTPAPVILTPETTYRLYPNPSAGRFMIDRLPSTGAVITVSDITGRTISQHQAGGGDTVEIRLPEHISGILLVEIAAPGYANTVKKVVVSH